MIATQVSTMGIPVPYITLAEFKRSPISNQLQKLVPNSSPADLDGELNQIIRRITGSINSYCGQNLAATVDTEIGQMVVGDDGGLRIHTRGNPIVQVLNVSIGNTVSSLAPVTDLSNIVLDAWRITIPQANGLLGLNQNLQFGRRPGQRLWCQWTYINGYPVTTLASPASAGDTEITVVDATGILPTSAQQPTSLNMEDGKYFESFFPSAVSGNVLTVPPLLYSHAVGTGVSNLPDDVKEALLLLVSRIHDSWSKSSGSISHDETGARRPGGGSKFKLCDPADILKPYRRVL